jgi:hypothetical protein
MANYYKWEGPWTIAPGATVGFSVSWAAAGTRGDRGPIVPMADPKTPGRRRSAVLVTLDTAKGRTGGRPHGGGSVFYEFKVRNDSSRLTSFGLELVEFEDAM